MSDLAKLPFIAEGTLAADANVTLYVKDDDAQGLREPGRTGYIKNDGAGSITVQCIDDSDNLSDVSTVKANEQLIFESDDDIDISEVHIVADASGASYRARFARLARARV